MTISPVRPAPEGAVGNLIGRRPALFVSAASAAFVALCVALWPPTKDPYDLQVYVVAAHAVLNGQDIYTAHAGNPILLGFTYPPFAALLFAPLGAMSAGAGRLVMSVLSAVALLVIGSITVRALKPHWPKHRIVAAGIALGTAGLAIEPVRMTFHYGQINLMLVAVLMIDLFGVLPRRFRGVLIGVATGIKLTPGIFIIYLLVTRRYREAATAAAATAATMLIGFLAMPDAAWKFWTTYIFDPTRPGSSTLVSNQAWRGVIDRLSGGPQGLGPVWIIAVAGTVVLGFITVRRCYDRGRLLESVLLTAAIGLLVSPISWTAHWVWALPACALLWTRVFSAGETWMRARYRIALAALTTVTFGIGLPWLAPYMDDRELHHHGFQLYLGNSYAICAAVLLLAAAKVAKAS
ncbi:glycosyltransferase 87 family protein [Kribbella sp. NPDC058245]|uniref:glycosyltransferase 87 family protein n=1 Tax=Kribbella sp. NPDC058245 TaxID=3346399 RepID=UPI0036E6D58D